MSNKIRFGLKNLYYAKITAFSDAGVPTYAEPVRIPGARSLNADPEGELVKWYADDGVYWSGASNNGYSGSIEVALLPDSFRKDILGDVEDTNGVLVETQGATGSPFALLFEFTGDQKGIRHVIYNCTVSRPGMDGETKEENIDPQPDTIDFEAGSVYVTALDADVVKTKTAADTDTTVYEGWYSAVYIPA